MNHHDKMLRLVQAFDWPDKPGASYAAERLLTETFRSVAPHDERTKGDYLTLITAMDAICQRELLEHPRMVRALEIARQIDASEFWTKFFPKFTRMRDELLEGLEQQAA